MGKFTLQLKNVSLNAEEQSLMNNVPLSFFEESDNLLINDGKIVGYQQVQNIAETFIPFNN